MGLFLHMVVDRNSHYYCTDSENSKIFGPNGKGDYSISLDEISCNIFKHGMNHYWE